VEFRHLRTFVAVARTLSFTRAATELHYAQSSVTEQMQSLEAQLDVTLFDRAGRKLTLTPAGEMLLGYAERLLLLTREARSAVRAAAGGLNGELTVGGLETLCASRLPAILADFQSEYPGVRVRVRRGGRGEVYDWVRRGEIDVALTFGPAPADRALASEVIGSDRLMVVSPLGHRLAGLPQIYGADLRGEPFLATPRGCCFREMLDQVMESLGADAPTIGAEVESMAVLCQCASVGMGCALLPETAARVPAERGEIVAVPFEGAGYRTQVRMTWSRRAAQTGVVAGFLDRARIASRAEQPESAA
jgi:DNA-binding transcriptional LysR family regulator